MIPIWLMTVPLLVAGALFVVLSTAKRLQFFSRAARHLEQIDIPNEVIEIRINELDALIGDQADWMFKNAWKITRWERRRGVSNRHRHIRKWLYLIVSNCVLFSEVARFHLQEAESPEGDAPDNSSDLSLRVLDRAAMLQFMAAICLGKLLLFDCRRLVWPFYVPFLSDHFQVRGHDLIAWYRHLGREMLELVQHYYDDVTYTRFIYQLTGTFTVEDAAQLDRL